MNVRWTDGPPRYGYESRGVYRGVELVAKFDKPNGARVSFLGQTVRTSSFRNQAEARNGLADLLRRAKDRIDSFLATG